MSLLNKKWHLYKSEPEQTTKLAHELSISEKLAQILINRGINDQSCAKLFINPTLDLLTDPMQIPNVDKAARIVIDSIKNNEKIMVFGDYDVDGVTGTAIIFEILSKLGADIQYYIPHRYDEGYGLNNKAIKEAKDNGVSLLITVDCGVSNVEQIAYANSLGLKVIVTDHHNIPEILPNALAIVNPKLIPEEHSSRHLSGAGVAFKFVWALMRISGHKESTWLVDLLDLAALGTVADVVPLKGENRILAVQGMKIINRRSRPGIKALIKAAGIGNKKVSVRNVNFALAPRINAAGRLEHASMSLELMLSKDEEKADELASSLNKINIERQKIGENISSEVFAELEQTHLSAIKLITVSGKAWHNGVIGIVASRVLDRYCKPVVLIGVEDGIGRGSARSLEGIDMYELLYECRDLFVDFGGHSRAAGFEIEEKNIPQFKERMNDLANEKISAEMLVPKVTIDMELLLPEISMTFIKEIQSIDPYGEGNPMPVFIARQIKVMDARLVGADSRHLKIRASDGKIYLDVMGFGMGSLHKQIKLGQFYDMVFELESNEWNGSESAQLNLIDLKESSK